MRYDVIIVGAGPAGMSAALYCLRDSLKVLLLEKETFGGQIATSPRLENYPSIKAISGLDFSSNLFDQVMDLGCDFELEDVNEIEKKEDYFEVKTNYNIYETKRVIVATGLKHKHLTAKNEEKFEGKGISYCATCDGAIYKGKDIALIGDANTALQYALLLSTYCNSIKVCTLFDKWFGDKILVDKMLACKNLTYQHNLSLLEYLGNDKFEGLKFEDTKTKEIVTVKCDGVFVAIGQEPHNEFLKGLADLEKGFIVTDERMETKTKGIYAIGDCRSKEVRQVATAVGDAAIAAVNCSKSLR